MKTSLASALSVAGVVAAGAAAFALNTAVLTTGASDAGTITSTTAQTATETGFLAPGGASASGAQASGDTLPVNQSGAADPGAVTTESTQVAATLTTYKVGTAGSVVLDSADGTLSVRNIVPSAGWTAEPARTDADGTVRVHFVKGSSRLEFVARINNGKTTVEVNNDSAPTAATRPPRSDDDDEHEEREHEGGEHEDDEHEDDEHEEWHDDDDD
jgi:hypothetical protein